MPISGFRKYFKTFQPALEKGPEEAYDLWSTTYDQQLENLVLKMEEKIFAGLLKSMDMSGKTVLDYGCGTGRHWPALLEKKPIRLMGIDISEGMLSRLKIKYPCSEVYKSDKNCLSPFADGSMDFIISTLTIAHIRDIELLFFQWNRLLADGGSILLTDFHPEILLMGGKRNFISDGNKITIQNFIHSVRTIEYIASALKLCVAFREEIMINENVFDFYRERNAMHVYKKFYGKPLIYGIAFKKNVA